MAAVDLTDLFVYCMRILNRPNGYVELYLNKFIKIFGVSLYLQTDPQPSGETGQYPPIYSKHV